MITVLPNADNMRFLQYESEAIVLYIVALGARKACFLIYTIPDIAVEISGPGLNLQDIPGLGLMNAKFPAKGLHGVWSGAMHWIDGINT